MPDPDLREGGCLCGAVRYAAMDVPHHLHACHCGICRKISGSATISVAVPHAAMQIKGEESIVTYASSDWAARSFCGRCGVGLWYRSTGDDAASYIISAGTLDDPSGMVLSKEIYVDCKPDGYAFAGDHPRLTGAEFEALHANAGE
jgi:hypothetical protein